MPDAERIHSPEHYQAAGVECIDVMRNLVEPEEFATHCQLTAFKYLWRAGKKNSVLEDLRKAEKYIAWAIEALEESAPKLSIDPQIRARWGLPTENG